MDMKEQLKPISQAFEGTSDGLDGIIEALRGHLPPEPPPPPPPPPRSIITVTYENGDITEYEIENEIGKNSIPNKENAIEVEIGDGITAIGEWAFGDCNAKLSSITIPDSVLRIEDSAFFECNELISIEIPDSVTSIGEWVFYECDNLSSVSIGNGITHISEHAFDSCTNLKYFEIPDSVTSIGDGAFAIIGIDSITIPNSVTSIGYEAFYGCNNLSSIIVDLNNSVYDSRDNCNAIIRTADNTLIQGCKNTVIPNDVTSIGKYAFGSHKNLTSIVIPDSITNIGESAFHETGLTSITIPNSVTSIEKSTFGYCRSLRSITIPDGVTSIGELVFNWCTSLQSITIPTSVTSIGSYSFSVCSNLSSVTFEGKDKATVQGMANFRWSIGANKIICTDGTL